MNVMSNPGSIRYALDNPYGLLQSGRACRRTMPSEGFCRFSCGEDALLQMINITRMEKVMKRLFVAAVLVAATCAWAQDNALELMRQDIKTEKIELMMGSLPLTAKQSDVFWPIYRDYDHELSKLTDKRLAVVKEVFAKYDSMDAKTAQRLVKASFSISQGRNKLLEKYYMRFSKAVGVITAARFLQVESQMLTLLDAQLMDRVPLIKVKSTGEPKK